MNVHDENQPSQRPRVLVVEDEAVIRLAIEDQLLRSGFDPVALAQDHRSALSAAETTTFDVVLMDINLGRGPDGIETAAAILEHVDVPVIFLTAYGNAEVVQRAMSVAPYGYLLKPFDDGLLQITIRLALTRHAADTSLRSLAAAVDQAPIGILVVDSRGDRRAIGYANREFERLSGASRDQILGRSPCFLADDAESAPIVRLRTALAERRYATEIVEARGAEGSFTSSVTLAPVRSERGVVSEMVMLHADLTPVRRAQDAAAAQQRGAILGRLVAGVTHDFNNVLASILSLALLAEESDDPEEVRRDLAGITTAARRGASVARRLLTFARPDGSREQVGTTDCVANVRSIVESARQLTGPNVQVRLETTPGPLFVGLDEVSFEQVLLNLVSNARDAMAGGGTLVITLEAVADQARLTVRDTGHGMESSILERVFEPGFTTRGNKATGLGLWVVELLVRRAGGSIGVASDPDLGTTVSVTLPLVAAPTIDSIQTAWRDLRVEGTCLLVDDDAALAAAYARALRRVGLDVFVAHSLAAAKRELARHGGALTLLVTDLDLAGSSGVELVHALERHAPTARAIVMSGYVDVDPASIADASLLWKPFSLETLVRSAVLAIQRPSVRAPSAPPRAPTASERPTASEALAIASDRVPSIPSAPPPPASSVLLFEEDAEVRAGLASVLRRHELNVLEASSVADAVALLGDRPVDLVLADVGNPDPRGFEIVEAARRRDAHVPAVVMTAVATPEVAKLSLQHRASGFLSKPVGASELLAEVEQAISASQVARLQRKLMRVSHEALAFLDDLPDTTRRFALSVDALFMVYQPIVRAYDGTLYAYEALVRSRGPFANPGAFIAAAEALGRMDELGRAIRRRIAADLEAHPERRELVFVNLHPTEFDERLVSAEEPLIDHAARVVFEVTERAQLSSDHETLRTLGALRTCGYRVALDDLGEGYAGLNWISRLGPDVVKLDMTLVRGIDGSSIKRDIVAAVVSLCRRSRILVVAEGVETSAEAATLRTLGSDLLQGYFFARPSAPFVEVVPREGTTEASP
jgi:PAS domain S-box-containing protein